MIVESADSFREPGERAFTFPCEGETLLGVVTLPPRESVHLGVLMVVVALLFPLLHWARYRFRLTAEALEIESGVFRRTVRRIPVSRIQDLGTKAGVLHRALGVVTVRSGWKNRRVRPARTSAIFSTPSRTAVACVGRYSTKPVRKGSSPSKLSISLRRNTDCFGCAYQLTPQAQLPRSCRKPASGVLHSGRCKDGGFSNSPRSLPRPRPSWRGRAAGPTSW